MQWSRLVWILLPAFAVVELLSRSIIASGAPTADDFDQAAEFIREDYERGDLVVVAPRWSSQARVALDTDLLPLDDQARPDEDTYRRLWQVSIRNATSPEASDLAPEVARAFGSVTVHRYLLEPTARVAYDFVKSFRRARVLEGSGQGTNPCHRTGQRWRCNRRGRDEWIGTETISDLEHNPRRCVWAHPLPNERELRIEFRDISSLEDGWIAGHTATDYVIGRHCGPDPVDFSVEVNGRQVLEQRHTDCDGWSPFRVELPPDSSALDVTFVISAPRSEGRHFCFQAQLRGRP